MPHDLTHLSDAELMLSLKTLVRSERRHLVAVLRHLAEMDRRRLANKQGFPSLFDYCVRELRYAEGEAARRIHAARAAAKYPMVYRAIDRGLLSLTTVSLLAPHLKWDNHRRLLREALGRNKRAVEKLVASLTPATERPERIRFLGLAAATDGSGAGDASCAEGAEGAEGAGPRQDPSSASGDGAARKNPAPLPGEPSGLLLLGAPPAPHKQPGPSAQRVEFTFTGDEALLEAVERAKQLLRHKHASVGYEEVFVEAVRALLERIDPDRRPVRLARHVTARSGGPAAGGGRGPRRITTSRVIPQRVKDEVWRRDGGRCAFVGPGGRRCSATGGLEYDHLRPWAQGGRSDDPTNVRILCAAHNGLEARRAFGDAAVDAAIARTRRAGGTGRKTRGGHVPAPEGCALAHSDDTTSSSPP